MLRDKPLHHFFFECDPHGFYDGLSTYCTPWIDVCCILTLVRRYRPESFLEVGCHRGFTTRILAQKFPEMRITAVDPGDTIPVEKRAKGQTSEYLPQPEVCALARQMPNVTLVRGEFTRVDWANQRYAMIFIDGNHQYDAVLADSRLALKLIEEPGVIIWHDANNHEGVNRALAELNLPRDIITIHNTWIAYYDTH